ncbi:uncharacterized protein LOC110237925 isoform X2 [Exaiptasia diaphana]|uniref:Uncharacterized protein n=1 Tax=Exaiptasia diaphana TaxID=2652724 RepID=A0A913YN24_EXADI|nr:uncharacterized protein LOC110237925 isoform X2 [Exaiptasia diaphana]
MRPISWLSINFIILSFIALCPSVHNTDNGVVVVKREQDPTNEHGEPDGFGSDYTWTDCRTRYKANLLSQGFCQCPSKKSTYFYFNDQCNSNVDIENLISHAQDTPPSEDVNFKNVKTFHGQCRSKHVFYFDDSIGKLHKTTNFVNIFSLKKEKQFVHLDWRPLSESILDGRLIIIEFTNCTIEVWKPPRSSVSNPCIMFKAQGSLIFPEIDLSTKTAVPSSSTKSPLSLYSASPSSTILSGSPHSTLSTPPSTWLKIPTQTPSATPSPSPSSTSTLQSTSTVLPGILPIKPTSSPNPTSSKSPEAAKNVSSHTGAIVGSVIAVLAVALVVVFVVLICRRRKQKTWRRETGTQHSTNNPTYGRRNTTETIELPQPRNTAKKEDEFEYDYAAMDGDPRSPGYLKSNHSKGNGVYQSLMPDSQQASVYTPLNRENIIVSDQPSEYNKIERPLFKPARPTDPLYNVLQRPDESNDDYLEPGVQICAKEPTSNRDLPINEPVYNVLEGPNDDNDSAPESDMGHMGHYRLDSDGYESTFEMMPVLRTKDDPTYEAPSGPLSESTYQHLDIKSPDDGMYQPLDQASRVIEHSCI